MSYLIEFTPSARKDLKKISSVALKKIVVEIEKLQFDPRPSNCKKLVNSNSYRVRAGDYRIIYDIEDKKLLILVIKIGNRKDIYR